MKNNFKVILNFKKMRMKVKKNKEDIIVVES